MTANLKNAVILACSSLTEYVEESQRLAGTALPVIYLNGDSLAKLSPNLDALKPFGLSDTPLSIEGEIARPDPFQLAPRYHILVDPKYLRPRRQ